MSNLDFTSELNTADTTQLDKTYTNSPKQPFGAKKNVFTVHSGITVVMMNLIIRYYNLDPQSIYVLSRKSCLQAVLDLNLIPRHQILNTDDIYQFIDETRSTFNHIPYLEFYESCYNISKLCLNRVLTLLDDNISPKLKISQNCNLGRDYFTQVDFKKLYRGECNPCFEPYEEPTPPNHNLDFNLFTQHCSDPLFNSLVQSKHCRCVKYCEEGTINYIDYDVFLIQDHEDAFSTIEQEYPQFNYEYTGIQRHKVEHLFRFDTVKNPNLDLELSGFIGVSNLSFKLNYIDHQWQNGNINLDIIANVATNHIPKLENSFYLQQQEIYQHNPAIVNSDSIQQAIVDPEFIGNYVNIIVCENQSEDKISPQEFLDTHIELINRVTKQGVFFFFLKFHPLCKQSTRNLLLNYLNNQQQFVFKIIDDHVCLEQVFCDSAPYTFIVHTISSSVGIYASKFSQLVFTYGDIYQDIPYFKELKDINSFDLQKIINYFNHENNTNLNYRLQS